MSPSIPTLRKLALTEKHILMSDIRRVYNAFLVAQLGAPQISITASY